MMAELTSDLVKTRDIVFRPYHPDPSQAETARQLLDGLDGVLEADALDPVHLRVTYHLPEISLRLIVESLEELGFHLDGSLVQRMRRALIYYSEETQCANMGCSVGQSNCTVKVFVNRYQRLTHGCRDRRPEHWRHYL
jgi:hypothetical protein